jgi:tripeptide aminopeptidase
MAAEAISNMTLGRLDEETTANIGRIEGGSQTYSYR